MWVGTRDGSGLRARAHEYVECFNMLPRPLVLQHPQGTAVLLPKELSAKVAVEYHMYAAPPWFSSRGPCKLGKDEWVIILFRLSQ